MGVDVSIPFREELHSDTGSFCFLPILQQAGFHPFQGRAPFGQDFVGILRVAKRIGFHPFQGRAPFGLLLKLFHIAFGPRSCFHPFQGRAPFGLDEIYEASRYYVEKFPSLSGKSSIRTFIGYITSDVAMAEVSIPFREELHSDNAKCLTKSLPSSQSFHPFQGRAPFGLHSDLAVSNAGDVISSFPSLSGKSSIRTQGESASLFFHAKIVSIPFREELHSDNNFERFLRQLKR